jgi:hypothetical protein
MIILLATAITSLPLRSCKQIFSEKENGPLKKKIMQIKLLIYLTKAAFLSWLAQRFALISPTSSDGKLMLKQRYENIQYLYDIYSDPMRITKKYAGTSCIGKQIFQPSEQYLQSADIMRQTEAELEKLEQKFLTRIYSKSSLLEEEFGASSNGVVERRTSGRQTTRLDFSSLFSSTTASTSSTTGGSGNNIYEYEGAARWKGKRVKSAPDLAELHSRYSATSSTSSSNGGSR